MPPPLSYMNSKLRSSRQAAEDEAARPSTAPSGKPHPPSREAETLLKSARRGRTFLKDNELEDAVLPQPLPTGIPYVATFTTFDDLIQRKILQQPEENQVHLSTNDVSILFGAKCLDQSLHATWEREVRYMELLSTHCRGQLFSLKENGLGPASGEAIAHVLGSNEFFSILDLAGNRLSDRGALSIARLLKANDTIVHVCLSSNDIGHVGGAAIAKALERNNTVTSLDLGGVSGVNRNHLGARGSEALGDMLRVNQVLAFLNVSSNGLGTDGITNLSLGLEGNQTLLRLDLSSNNLGVEGSKSLSSALETTMIQYLDVSRNNITDRGLGLLARAITSESPLGQNLVSLNLEGNGITQVGCHAIGQMIAAAQNLASLCLCSNRLGAGVVDIARAIKSCTNLKELTMSEAYVGPAEGTALGNALASNASLETLVLMKNRLGDVGAEDIFRGVAVNKTLKALNLAGNNIGDAGGRAAARMLCENTTLQDLCMKQNQMSDSGGAIEEAVRKNTVLLHLDVSYNDFAYKAYCGIMRALSRNTHSWTKQEAPRLSAEIEVLSDAQKELYHVQEEIDLERRGIKEKSDDLLRRKEAARSHTEAHRRIISELEESLRDAVQKSEKQQEDCRHAEEAATATRLQHDAKIMHFNRKIDAEKDRKEKLMAQTERLRKQQRSFTEAEENELKPLRDELQRAETDRNSDLDDAKWQGENLTRLELRVKQMEKALGIVSAKTAPSPSKGAKATAKKK